MAERRIDTVAISADGQALEIIDQTRLPAELRTESLTSVSDVWSAIAELRVRGAPAIGIAAAFGAYLGAKDCVAADARQLFMGFREATDYLASARPTAVNLRWALNRMDQCFSEADKSSGGNVSAIRAALLSEARLILEEDRNLCDSIGSAGLSLIRPGMSILTHCNAGRLATGGIGTALAPIYKAHEAGYGIKMYCDETRPLLQGARLTAWELSDAGIDTTLICDNMAASMLSEGVIGAVFVGCDRMASNGDAANKIGTMGLAIIARHFGVPFYVCLPYSTVDATCEDGSSIVIEQRSSDEVTDLWYAKRMAPPEIKVRNPAFDVTPASLISAVVTEKGVFRPPYRFR